MPLAHGTGNAARQGSRTAAIPLKETTVQSTRLFLITLGSLSLAATRPQPSGAAGPAAPPPARTS